MKGMALSIIAAFILAIISIIILIIFIGTNMSPAIKKSYCDIVRGFVGMLPLPEHMKPSLPSFCSGTTTQNCIDRIETADPDDIAFEIAAQALACWEKTGKMNVGQNTNCCELVLKRINGVVTRERVIDKITEANYKDKIDWQAGIISTAKSIGISYNATTRLIVVD